MSCGQTRLASKIRLMKYVAKHPEWKCTPTCFSCKYWETCYYEMMCEEDEIEDRFEWEYRVMTTTDLYYTVDYREAIARVVEWRNLGYDPVVERRPFDSSRPWQKII